METTLNKEQKILGVCYECTKQIKKLMESSTLKLNNVSKYTYTFVKLMESCEVEFDTNLEPVINSPIQNDTGNFYAYFKRVKKFLDMSDTTILKNLNESAPNPFGLANLSSFKTEVTKIIKLLESQDDIKNSGVTDKILKLKSWFTKPLFVHGVNLVNNVDLVNVMLSRFNIRQDEIISVVYNKSERILYYVCDNKTIQYLIDKDEFEEIKFTGYDINNYLDMLKAFTQVNDMLVLHVNSYKLNLQYSDNLYSDMALTLRIENHKQKISK